MSSIILSTNNLVCGYDELNPLTMPLNLEIEKNDIIAILGTNGRGKSTLLHTLLGIQKPLSGHIISDCSLSFVPQHFSSAYNYSVLDIVLMGSAKQLGLFSKPTLKDIAFAKQNLLMLGLQTMVNYSFNNLSGGQKQLVLIARALNAESQILLLDEPTSALDLYNQKQVLHILTNLIKERDLTILFSTHDPAQAKVIANKVILLDKNKCLFGATQILLNEAVLSQLYSINMKHIVSHDVDTIVPIYTEE